MPMTLDDFYYLMQHPIDSAVGTAREFMSHLVPPERKKKKDGSILDMPAPSPSPQVQTKPRVAYPSATLPFGRELTPEEELKVTSQAGQLAILNRGIRR